MVARRNDAKTPSDVTETSLAASVFAHWRAALTAALRAAASAPSRLGTDVWLAAVTGLIVRPGSVVACDDLRGARLVSRTGYACLAAGTALAALVTWRSGAGALAAGADAATLLVWAAARWAVMRLAAAGEMRVRPAVIDAAWAGGLIPLVMAATPVLNVVALAASAVLTWRALRAAGGSKREAWLIVGAAFGGQAAVGIVAWVVRGGVIYGFLLRR